MKKYVITFRSVTYAQRGEKVLKRASIDCLLRRTPKVLAKNGCGYCLQIRSEDAGRAVTLLQEAQLQYEMIFAIGSDGSFEEISI